MVARNDPRRTRGYSFIELVIVLLILAILAAAGGLRYSRSVHRFRVEEAARTVAADLQFARAEAQRRSAPRHVEFDTVADSYRLLSVDDLDDDSKTYTVELGGPDFGVAITSANFGGASVASFDMYGRPTNAGSMTVQSGSESRTVTLHSDGTTSTP